MTAFDYAVIVIIALSVLLGWWRGAVYEILSLMGWIVAALVARLFALSLASYLPDTLGTETIRTIVAFVALFVVTLIAAGVGALLMSKFIKWVGLGRVDKSLGMFFGMMRGVLLVLALVLLAGMTGLPKEPFWHDARLSKPLQRLALASLVLLPDSMAQRVNQGLSN